MDHITTKTSSPHVISNAESESPSNMSSSKKRRFSEITGGTDMSENGGMDVDVDMNTSKAKAKAPDESIDDDDDGDVFMAPKYNKGDRVYACDGGEVYLSTIKRSKASIDPGKSRSRWKYFVHFQGWNARHDRWLDEERLMPDNDKARQLAKVSKSKAAELEKKRKEKKLRLEKERKERKANNNIKKAKDQRNEIQDKVSWLEKKCTLPFDLQRILIEDQFQITKLGKHTSQGYDAISTDTTPARKLHNLPSTRNVERLLKHFAKTSIKSKQQAYKDATDGDACMAKICDDYNSFASEMITLFNSMLPKYLLYHFEHAQFSNVCEKSNQDQHENGGKQAASQLYSGEFLLRMLVKLPKIISTFQEMSSLSSASNKEGSSGTNNFPVLHNWGRALMEGGKTTGQILSELISYLSKNKGKIFRGEYRGVAVDEYTKTERKFAEKQSSRQSKLKEK